MKDHHYKLILIVALLACAVPAFMSYDLYHATRESRLAYESSAARIIPTPYQNCIFDLKDMIFTTSIINMIAFGTLLLLVVYLTNRTYISEQKLKDIEVK